RILKSPPPRATTARLGAPDHAADAEDLVAVHRIDMPMRSPPGLPVRPRDQCAKPTWPEPPPARCTAGRGEAALSKLATRGMKPLTAAGCALAASSRTRRTPAIPPAHPSRPGFLRGLRGFAPHVFQK